MHRYGDAFSKSSSIHRNLPVSMKISIIVLSCIFEPSVQTFCGVYELFVGCTNFLLDCTNSLWDVRTFCGMPEV